MGKKQTLNVADAIAQDLGISTISTENNGGDIADSIAKDIGLTPSIQPYSLSDVEKDVEKTRLKEVQAEKSRELYDTRPEYAGLNKEEKEYLVKKEKEGKLVGEDLARAAWTMAGNDPTQKKVAEKDAKGNKIYSDLGELYKKGEEKGFFSSALTDIELSKYSGGNYYMKDRGDGTLVPVPLAYNEKPEAKNVKDAQVFSSLDDDAYGDSRFVDVAKKAWNIIPAVAQGFVSIPETVQGLITGKTGKGYEVTKDVLEAAKFKTSQEFQKGIIDSQKIDEFSDFLSKDVYDLSPDKIINTVVNVASSLGEFAVTRKFVPVGGKAGTFAAGTVMNIKEPLQAAEDAGVEGRAKYAVAATYALAASGLETALGIEGKIFDDAATVAKKQMINKIIKDNVDVVGGKLTKESVENLYKETLKEVPSFYAKYAKNTVGEVTEEVAQNMIQNATQQIHDMVVKDDPEAAKFNTKFWSPEALAEYANSAFGGLIGGVAGSRFIKNKQSQTAYDAIRDGKENDLKVQLASSLKEGRLTQDDYNRAIFKIDSYKQYYDATKDRNVTDEEKRKIFDLTYEKENTKSGLENIKQNNPGGINDGLIAAKEQEVRDYTQQINDIWSTAEARTSESPVAESKAQVPQWKTDLDTFSKEVGNADKQVSQNFVTKDKIETAVGASPQLNELAKPFSVDFKAPHLPEDAGNIQIRDGVLYEPYLVKQEGKEDVVNTRQLPVYAMEDKDGGTWLFASGEKTDLDAPDVSYLIKLNEEGGYEGHQEFKYETAKKNELTFDDIVPTFNKLGIKTASLTDEIKGIENIPQAEFEEVEEFEEFPEEKGIVESEQFKNVYEKVKAGVGKAKLKLLPNNTVGVTINGEDVPFASQRYLNKEDLPSGDVEVNVRTVENIEGKYGRGVLIETQEGVPLGYIRRAGKVETGRVAAEKISPTEDVDIDVPVELTDAAKEKIQQIEKDQENYELVEDELGRRYVNKKTGESYNSVSTFVSGKSGGDFKGDKRLKETAFKVGNIINGIVKDFFNGTIKSYSNYTENISRDDYDDIVRQLQDVLEYAKDKGYSIVTKPLIIADDVNKIAGQPNVLMIDENGKFYVYDVATLRNKQGVETKELLNKRYKDRPTNAERISAQVNILADILNNKYGLEVGKVGVIPFDVDYEVAKEGQPVQITQAVRTKRVDFKRKQILKPTGKTTAAEVKEKVEEVKPEEKAEGKVPLTITSQVRQQLYDLGYSKEDVNAMKPEQAQGIIEKQAAKPKASSESEKILKAYPELKDTKVTDRTGAPLLVYHGGVKFDDFNPSQTKNDKGIYFTDNKDFALYFAHQAEIFERDKRGDDYRDIPEELLSSGEPFPEKYFKYAKVHSAYLDMKNPTIVDAIDAKDIPKNYEPNADGFIAKYTGDFGYKGGQYVVFDPKQIKNANVKAVEQSIKEQTKAEAKPVEKEVVKEEVKTEEQETKEQLKETESLLSGDAEKNRKTGKFVKNGIEFVRNKKGQGEKGNQGQVRFTNEAGGAGVVVPFRYKIIEAETLQPSHEGGIRNPLHFIPEAQPKNRNDAGSLQAEDSFAENPRFNELGENTNAYSGAPIVNERNEVIQGNNRSAGLRKGYKQGNEKYKKDLVDNAEKFGFTKEQVSEFKEPILVRETAVTDEFSIELGNYDAKDLETGGKRRIDPVAVVRRMPFDVKGKISNILFREEDKTLNQAIRDNIKDFINLINPYLNQAQRNTIFKDGELTEAGAKDLEGVVQQFLYDGGDVALPELFESLSYNQKEGIKKSLPNIFSVGYEKSIIPEIQEAIIALSNFNASGVDRFNNWLTQQDMFAEGKTPKEIYTPVALELAKTLNSATSQKQIQKIFAEYAGLVKDKPADMFEEAKEGLSKKEGIKQIFKVEYEESKKISERGGAEIDKEPSAEGNEDVAEQKAKSVKSIFDEAVKLFYKIRGTEGAAKKRNLTQERKELLKENPSVRFIDNNISSIFEQLEKQGIIKRKGNCP